jgi:hypothetical protein
LCNPRTRPRGGSSAPAPSTPVTQGRERWQLPHKPLYHDGGCVEAARVRVQRGDGEGDGVRPHCSTTHHVEFENFISSRNSYTPSYLNYCQVKMVKKPRASTTGCATGAWTVAAPLYASTTGCAQSAGTVAAPGYEVEIFWSLPNQDFALTLKKFARGSHLSLHTCPREDGRSGRVLSTGPLKSGALLQSC